jgi:integrase
MKQLVRLNKRPSSDGSSFTYVLRYTDLNGKRRWDTLGHANERKAEKQRTQKEKELRMGYVVPGSLRLSEFLKDSMIRTGDQIRESTRIDYASATADLIKAIGDLDYQSVQQAHGEKFRQMRLDHGDSPATVAKKLRALKRIFQLAVERDQLDENPLRYVKAPRVSRQKIRVYNADECERMVRAASEVQNEAVLEWDLLITVALTTGMRKSELLNLVWSNVDFSEMTLEVSPKHSTDETWEWRIKDTDRRWLPLREDVCQLLTALQNQRPSGYPYVFVPPGRYDHIQENLRPKGKWTLSSARNSIINNFKRQFDRIVAMAHIDSGTFHDVRKTAITNWLRQGLSEYDVMTLAGHADFKTTHRFYLAVADDLMQRARQATVYEVGPELLEKCCRKSLQNVHPCVKNWCKLVQR